MIIRKGQISDLSRIMEMYASCVKGMIKNGIDQWDENYPNPKIITSDINSETYYVAERNGDILGGVNIDRNQDKTYLDINWEDQSPYFLVVHRLAAKEEVWGRKVGKNLMIFAN